MSFSPSRRIAIASTIGLTSISSFFILKDEGTKRSLQFWSSIFPVYIHYRTYQLLNRDLGILSDEYADSIYNQLHEKYSDYVKSIVYKMRGFYLKNAQLLSTQDDFVPKAYMRWVKDTQDNVPSDFREGEAKKYLIETMKNESNLNFDDIFYDWNEKPLGIASIGQVHSARLKSNNKLVAIKILCPNIESKFRLDIRTLKSFCRLAMPQHVTAFDEIEKQFTTEFNYIAEAKNLQLIRNAVLPKFSNYVDIPKPYLEYCSKSVLVMDFLDGVKLVDAEIRDRMMNNTYEYKSLSQQQYEAKIMKFKMLIYDVIKHNSLRFVYNYTIARVLFGPLEYQWTEQPIDLSHVLELLCKVHGYQLFHVGSFNGDCHPGNILLLKNGKLGLIDYGQVKTMSLEDRITYAKLIIAHSKRDKDEVVRIHFNEIKAITKYSNPDIGYRLSSFYNDRDTSDVLGNMNISSFIDYCQQQDPIIKLPEDFLFASRMNILLRGMGKAFGIRIFMSKMWEDDARKLLQDSNVIYK